MISLVWYWYMMYCAIHSRYLFPYPVMSGYDHGTQSDQKQCIFTGTIHPVPTFGCFSRKISRSLAHSKFQVYLIRFVFIGAFVYFPNQVTTPHPAPVSNPQNLLLEDFSTPIDAHLLGGMRWRLHPAPGRQRCFFFSTQITERSGGNLEILKIMLYIMDHRYE